MMMLSLLNKDTNFGSFNLKMPERRPFKDNSGFSKSDENSHPNEAIKSKMINSYSILYYSYIFTHVIFSHGSKSKREN